MLSIGKSTDVSSGKPTDVKPLISNGHEISGFSADFSSISGFPTFYQGK